MTFALQILSAIVKAYYKSASTEMPESLNTSLSSIFNSKEPLLSKIKTMDSIVLDLNIQEDVGELMFDILLYNFFSEDSQRLGEEFFNGKDWEKIEASIMERGTELLNIMLYLQECKDSEIKPNLDDYLDEYLTADDEFENEEFEVYEAILKNREAAVEGNIHTMLEISAKNPDSILGDQLLPILLYFETSGTMPDKMEAIQSYGSKPEFQSAFLAALYEFNKIELNLN